MKKIMLCIMSLLVLMISGCQKKEKIEWTDDYTLTYFYVEDCANCQHFNDEVLPAIEAEFGDHMTIVKYNMDTTTEFEEMKAAYDQHIDMIIDFNQDDYGFGPMVFLEGYIAILGAGNAQQYVDHLISAIVDMKMDKADDIETYYYLKDGMVKE